MLSALVGVVLCVSHGYSNNFAVDGTGINLTGSRKEAVALLLLAYK